MKEPKGKPAAELFSPIRIGPLELPNRIVMAPMSRSRAGEGNAPNCMNIRYYKQRASAGLIITEASQISPRGVGYPGTPGIHSYDQIAGWRRVVDGVHEDGGRIFLQLWHVGRISHPSMQPNGQLPVGPSAIAARGDAFTPSGLQPFPVPRALETREIPDIIAQYQRAAENARAAGFDGVELHGANGYLLDQFLRDGSNRRTDQYGGSIENRARLLLEVAAAVAGVWGPGRVGVRLSPISDFNDMRDSNPAATFGYAAEQLGGMGLAYLHVIEGEFDSAPLRRAFGEPYIANSGYDMERARAAIASGAADMVSFGKLFLANPDLPVRFLRGAALNEPDQATFYSGGEKGYTDYPALAPQGSSGSAVSTAA
ncbi:MAG: alkene reductase [Gammaproteobacteria bacterium]|nr:alkene reductase [Gammaproteobacteria bacterium]